MSKVTFEKMDSIAVLRMNNGVTNAISLELINDISEALITIGNEFQGMVLAGGDKFFSIGFDLPALIQYNRSEMTHYYSKFNEMALNLLTLPMPTCCVLSGHAVAGGYVIALTCDYRFGVSGNKRIGLNEIKLGVPVPYLADLILRQIVSDRIANDIIYGGEFITVSEANQHGLVDEVSSQTDVEKLAIEKIRAIAGYQKEAFSAIKSNRLETILAKYRNNFKTKSEVFIDCWFSEPTQSLLKEASRKFVR
ncbi:MAG: hypothetical protein A2161_03925 [Candidatus Schekmanbacteria bacterium RBG_13_48_7]|uniref:Enoyl-CoA hydratase n=1 Tax=Candidatus Schekmanbacteria bacterium RBG_13_48_7 TaxID=1817878 RepID=A0A1F7SAP7_9BACT|nr:MAG: hypothetical protein A2161_03925 [Candidatus Schekmanbacteria bacterium RBG_13_48_7]